MITLYTTVLNDQGIGERGTGAQGACIMEKKSESVKNMICSENLPHLCLQFSYVFKHIPSNKQKLHEVTLSLSFRLGLIIINAHNCYSISVYFK